MFLFEYIQDVSVSIGPVSSDFIICVALKLFCRLLIHFDMSKYFLQNSKWQWLMASLCSIQQGTLCLGWTTILQIPGAKSFSWTLQGRPSLQCNERYTNIYSTSQLVFHRFLFDVTFESVLNCIIVCESETESAE